MNIDNRGNIKELLNFLDCSPTAFHAVECIEKKLTASGYTKLNESVGMRVKRGGKYYVTRNSSSIIAFRIPQNPRSFMIAASHSDSPMFKIKPKGEMITLGKYTKLNVERYGGMIMSSWFDRPLSIAGRVIVRDGERFYAKNVNIERDIAIIPNVCIHFNRTVNDGYKYNPQVDMLPIIGDASEQGKLMKYISEAAEVCEDSIVSSDLFLYNRTKGAIIGLGGEYFSAPRIDNLECAYTTLEGFLTSSDTDTTIPMYCMFDNEETGSLSKQGADSTFLNDVITRISLSLDYGFDDIGAMIANSFMISADNAHAKHPNHPELSDCDNSPFMNGGVVIKSNANQKYTTDALSQAIFKQICDNANVPVQYFANRSDIPGGSTLGNISNAHVSINSVDIGLAQLAMHSSYETAGCDDVLYMAVASRKFYESTLTTSSDGIIELN